MMVSAYTSELLYCQGSFGRRLHGFVDHVGEVSLQAANGLPGGLPLPPFAGDVGLGLKDTNGTALEQ